MKLSLASLTIVAMATASPTPSPEFERLILPGDNYIAGRSLFPGNVISGYNADYDKWTKDTWTQHVLEQCKTFDQCTSSISYSAINSGTPKVRAWFGYCFRGGKTTKADYTTETGVQDTVVYTK